MSASPSSGHAGFRNPRDVFSERLDLLRLLPAAGVGFGAALLLVHTLAAVLPAVTAIVTARLVSKVAVGGDGWMGWAVALVGALALVQTVESAQQLLALGASRRIDGTIRRRVREIAMAPPGIAHLSDREYRDELTRAGDLGGDRGRRRSPGTAVTGQLALMSRIAGGLGAAVVVARASVPLALALVTAVLIMRTIIRRQWTRLAAVADAAVAQGRRTEYWSEMAAGSAAGKEVRVFGLAGWVVANRQEAALAWLSPVWREARSVLLRQSPVVVLALASAFVALAVPGMRTASGNLSLGTLAGVVTAAWGIFAIGVMGHEAFDIEYGRAAVGASRRLGPGRRPPAAGPRAAGDLDAAPDHVRLDRVTFRYPDASRPILDDLDLDLPPGKVLAVVGRNGAGKTTLAKLIAGLYRPTGGRVLVNGTDLSELDVEGWRSRMSVVFQDFVQYPLPLRDNVALSAPEHRTDEVGISDALRRAGAADLPAGLDTVLSREASGGTDLSGGQWQRVAIARALFAVAHGRRLLILDEPTAHLDVRAEAEFFDQVIRATRGISVVLVSHRLSTVRHADRIVRLDGGRVVESGTHPELMAAEGEYARLFRLQASRFDSRAADGEARR